VKLSDADCEVFEVRVLQVSLAKRGSVASPNRSSTPHYDHVNEAMLLSMTDVVHHPQSLTSGLQSIHSH